MARRRNPYYALPQDIRDKLRELVGGQRMWVPRLEREEIRARDREIVRRFHEMRERGVGSAAAREVLARSFFLSDKWIQIILYGKKRRPNGTQRSGGSHLGEAGPETGGGHHGGDT